MKFVEAGVAVASEEAVGDPVGGIDALKMGSRVGCQIGWDVEWECERCAVGEVDKDEGKVCK